MAILRIESGEIYTSIPTINRLIAPNKIGIFPYRYIPSKLNCCSERNLASLLKTYRSANDALISETKGELAEL